jgi:hypothetical protein
VAQRAVADDCKDAGGRAPKVGALGDAGAVADDCKDAGGRATQEQLPRRCGSSVAVC